MVDSDGEEEPLSEEELLEMAQKGELEIELIDQPSVADTFTADNFLKFIKGEITWAQLEGMTIDEAYAMAEMGHTFLEQGRIEDAKTIIEGLVIGNPYDAYLHSLLGTIYAREDNEEDAVEEFSIALGLDPENVDALVARGELFLRHGEFEDAMEDLNKAIELDPEGEHPPTLRARALAAATASAFQAALEEATEA
jgi:Flp pilus assembly protein TadD